MKSIRWTKRPITWGAGFIGCLAAIVIVCVGGLACLAEWYSPSWWIEFKEFVKRPFETIAKSRFSKEEP